MHARAPEDRGWPATLQYFDAPPAAVLMALRLEHMARAHDCRRHAVWRLSFTLPQVQVVHVLLLQVRLWRRTSASSAPWGPTALTAACPASRALRALPAMVRTETRPPSGPHCQAAIQHQPERLGVVTHRRCLWPWLQRDCLSPEAAPGSWRLNAVSGMTAALCATLWCPEHSNIAGMLRAQRPKL